MPPDSADANPASLPLAFRGYDRQATEELFRRVAWDYSVLAGEHRKLKQAMAETPEPARTRRGDPDEEAHLLLSAAHKAVREMRESARADCEQALKKAKGRAAEIEAEARLTSTEAVAVLDAAAALRSTLQSALRRLESGEPLAGPHAASVQDGSPAAVEPAT